MVPAPLDADLQKTCSELAVAALSAVDHQQGLSHVELKLTDTGPRIIEVNSRLGGYVEQVRTLAGMSSLLRAAFTTALSHDLPGPQPEADKVGWYWPRIHLSGRARSPGSTVSPRSAAGQRDLLENLADPATLLPGRYAS